jgi:hypothetical protein
MLERPRDDHQVACVQFDRATTGQLELKTPIGDHVIRSEPRMLGGHESPQLIGQLKARGLSTVRRGHAHAPWRRQVGRRGKIAANLHLVQRVAEQIHGGRFRVNTPVIYCVIEANISRLAHLIEPEKYSREI